MKKFNDFIKKIDIDYEEFVVHLICGLIILVVGSVLIFVFSPLFVEYANFFDNNTVISYVSSKDGRHVKIKDSGSFVYCKSSCLNLHLEYKFNIGKCYSMVEVVDSEKLAKQVMKSVKSNECWREYLRGKHRFVCNEKLYFPLSSGYTYGIVRMLFDEVVKKTEDSEEVCVFNDRSSIIQSLNRELKSELGLRISQVN